MATGIRKRHSRQCPAKEGGRCRCGAGWEASVWSDRDRKKIRKTFKRKAEAIGWRSDALAAVRQGTIQATGRDTVKLGDALRSYVDGMKSGKIRPKGRDRYKPNTIRSYELALNKHIEGSEIASLKVTAIRRRDIQDFADELLAGGLAAGTVSNILNPIQAYYRWAVDRDDLAANPAERINVAYGSSKRPRRIASAAEAANLLEALPPEDRPIWACAFYAGLRRGELQALRACDIDLGASLTHVNHGWDQEEGQIEPKSESSRRSVPMLAILRDYLDQRLLESGREGEDLIFGRSRGSAFIPSTLDNRAKRAWKRHNEREKAEAEEEGREPTLLEPLTMHECRHTFASLLIDSGTNAKAIQEFMGHSKISTTFDIYGHLLPGSHDEVRLRMDAYLEAAGRDQAAA